jgi:hypothetical protein
MGQEPDRGGNMTCQESTAMLDRMLATGKGMYGLTRAERSAMTDHFMVCVPCLKKLDGMIEERASQYSPAEAARIAVEGFVSGTRIAIADSRDPEVT